MLDAMKTRSLQTQALKISPSLWLAYAGAGAATALAGATSAEAEIHYSGPVNASFPAGQTRRISFPLDQAGDSLVFSHSAPAGEPRRNLFKAVGLVKGQFIGNYNGFEFTFVARLKSGNDRYISEGNFVGAYGSGYHFGTLFNISYGRGHWNTKGSGFVGFRFNGGSGYQYGWARVETQGPAAGWGFKVVDYAYADLGEPITVGQTSSSEANIPSEGSLGLLALGAAGVAIWRQRRKKSIAV
jgi:hypothetical protein